MIFSNETVSEALGAAFECAWESVGPVPQVRIDFGNGDVLETTLGGNVLTSFCLSNGTVVDLLPGVTTPQAYLVAAQQAAGLARTIEARPERQQDRAIREAQQSFLGVWPWVLHLSGGVLASKPGIRIAVDLDAVEPLPHVERAPNTPSLEVAVSKSLGELPLLTSIELSGVSPISDPLYADTRKVETILRPQARAVLASAAALTPAAVTPHVFRLVLKIDLDDPYLGLSKELVGSRLQR